MWSSLRLTKFEIKNHSEISAVSIAFDIVFVVRVDFTLVLFEVSVVVILLSLFLLFLVLFLRLVVVHKRATAKAADCGFDSHSKNIIYLIFSVFLSSSKEANHSVEFRHLTRTTSKIRQKVGNVLIG